MFLRYLLIVIYLMDQILIVQSIGKDELDEISFTKHIITGSEDTNDQTTVEVSDDSALTFMSIILQNNFYNMTLHRQLRLHATVYIQSEQYYIHSNNHIKYSYIK